MTVVAQGSLVDAKSVDELPALSNNTLSQVTLYAHDSAGATEADKHRKVAGDALAVLMASGLTAEDIDTLAELNAIITDATLIDTADARLSDARTPTAHDHAASEITSGVIDTARLGSGTADGTTFLAGDQTYKAIAAGGFPAFASSMRTASFTADSSDVEIIDIQDANDIIGTLPASPSDGDERIFYVRGEASDPLGRFQVALNGRTIQAGDAPAGTKSTSWESGLSAGYTELGIIGVTTLGASLNTNAAKSRTGSNSLAIGGIDPSGTAYIQFTLPDISGTSTLSLWYHERPADYYINGVFHSFTGNNFGSFLEKTITGLVTGDVIKIITYGGVGEWTYFDDLSITNVTGGAAPADWTDPSLWEVSPGGLLRIRWSDLLNTWVVVDYRA